MPLPMTPQFRRQVAGTLARAAEMHQVRIHAVLISSESEVQRGIEGKRV